jgi:MFS family permease
VIAATIDQGILRRPYRLTTLGSWSLVFLAAFESLAVTTIMPVITADLHGRSLYALAFSAALAAGVVGTVAAGSWSDRRGPTTPLLVSIAVFTLGLAVAGTAHSMQIFVAGRFLQGLGAGGETVALYVLIAKVYPAHLHTRLFGANAAAWVLPSLVGPFVAGVVADALSWHWVFLGVIVLVVAATAMIAPAVRGVTTEPAAARPGGTRRIVAATAVAVAVVALSYGWFIEVVAPVAIVVIVLAVRPLVPAGTYRARRGLPAAVLLCAAAGAAFFGTEVYLPLLLHDRYGLATWLSGFTLTAGAISWALASNIQGRYSERISGPAAIWAGGLLLAGGVLVELVTVVLTLPPAVAAVGWFAAGGGMGTLYPRVSALVLGRSAPGEEGFNIAAKGIADSVGGAVALAITGLLFGGESFWAVFAFSTAVGVAVVLIARRTGPAPSPSGGWLPSGDRPRSEGSGQ